MSKKNLKVLFLGYASCTFHPDGIPFVPVGQDAEGSFTKVPLADTPYVQLFVLLF